MIENATYLSQTQNFYNEFVERDWCSDGKPWWR